jgi:hypothetical protein
MNRTVLGRQFVLFGPLFGMGILQATCGLIYASMHSTPSAAASTILAISVALFVTYWVLADARQRHCVPCFEFGFLMAVFFPVSVIWYAFWTRGWRGVLLLFALLGLIYGPWLCVTIAWIAIHVVA